MIKIKTIKEQNLFDSWEHLSLKRKKLLKESWAHLIREQVLLKLPVKEIAKNYTPKTGRPSKEVYTMCGVVLLQQMFNYTDEETRNALAFNEQWHYALDIINANDDTTYICGKTLWTMRQIISKEEICKLIFREVTDELIQSFGIDTKQQRIDSVHIRSNMANINRVRLFSLTISKFIKTLKRQYPQYIEIIDNKIKERYLGKSPRSLFSMVKPEDAKKTLEGLAQDLFYLIRHFQVNAKVLAMSSYKLMQRVLSEQCKIGKSHKKPVIQLKEPKEVKADSLQNPSDPDATYNAKKGKGYKAQIMETYGKENPVNFITHVEAEKAHESDTKAVEPALFETSQRNIAPEKLLGDSLFGTYENQEIAKQFGTEIISQVMGKKNNKEMELADFILHSKHLICPAGNKSTEIKLTGEFFKASFHQSHCQNCEKAQICITKNSSKEYRHLYYNDRMLSTSTRRKYQETDEFKEEYKKRAGIEATISEIDRKTNIKHLRIRGFNGVQFCIFLKATAINIFRAASVKFMKKPQKILATALKIPAFCNQSFLKANFRTFLLLNFFIKEQIFNFFAKLKNFLNFFVPSKQIYKFC